MIYVFDDYELDTSRAELRKCGEPKAIEPQVFDLLKLLLDNAGRLVTKDELVEKIWNGRVVSESAITSRIKSARQAIGDDGKSQRLIKTVHGRGIRFVAPVDTKQSSPSITELDDQTTPDAPSGNESHILATRPSIAILPFQLVGVPGLHGTIAEALPHELITELARLRWLFVIARGSSFKFRSTEADVRAVGEALGVSYCLTGTVEIAGRQMTLTVELADCRSTGVVWADRYATDVENVHEVRTQIVSSIVSTLEIQITANEARLARLHASENLDAWSAYHLGLQHMYRFNKEDNSAAGQLFARAVSLDPGFCRAHAGLSFTHFQNAFLQYTNDPDAEAASARRYAQRSLELDALDPFANLTMGRSFWLAGDLEQSMDWLARATTLCPNYAKSIYSQAWAETVSGHGAEGQAFADTAVSLSPLDPLLYAMLATRALSHLVREDYAEAAKWVEKAARSPGAHVMIEVIAATIHTLNGDDASAGRRATSARRRHPGLTQSDFFRSFPFADSNTRTRIARALTKHGL